jgi:septal ring factor EnvC (AmiA/AmiB activator)
MKKINILLITLLIFAGSGSARADEVTDLQDKSSLLQNLIEKDNTKIAELGEVSATLQSKIEQLQTEVNVATNEITLTSIKLEQLSAELLRAQDELDKQKSLLKSTLRALYQKQGATTVELIMSSDSFSDYISSQEYLERLKDSVKTATENVIQLKLDIESQKTDQESLLKRQQLNKGILDQKKNEQATLLEQTKGEEAKYQEIVKNRQSELQAAEQNLQAILAERARKAQIGLPATNLGPVSRNQQLGGLGSTGYSTGPHIHFMVTQNGSTINPRSVGDNQLINGYTWPLPNGSWSDVSQEYGCVAPPGYYFQSCNNGNNSVHTGLDISGWYGDPIVAAADGVIVFRGCSSGLGYVVIVDHGGGWQTWYPHMTTPSGQSSGYCSE